MTHRVVVPEYVYFGFNRQLNAPKDPGGRYFGKRLDIKVFDISVIDESFDEILGLKLRHRHSEFNCQFIHVICNNKSNACM